MEMACNAAKAFRDRSILPSDAAHVRPKTFSIDSCVHLQACQATIASSLRDIFKQSFSCVGMATG